LHKTQASIDGQLAITITSLKRQINDQNGEIDELQGKLAQIEHCSESLKDEIGSLKKTVGIPDRI
jgi:peptidoglycan hydrolase CwlO-like protein